MSYDNCVCSDCEKWHSITDRGIDRIHKFVTMMEKAHSKKSIITKQSVECWVKKMYGKRCGRYTASCPACRAWSCFDYLFMTTNETMWIKHLKEQTIKEV